MAESLELPTLYVEGEYDKHTIIHLVKRHGIELDKDVGPVIIKKAKNDRGVLASMRTAARASTLQPVGFVVDADIAIASRWQSVSEHLRDLGLVLPPSAPSEGFIGESIATKSRIGVWIMPNNKMDEGRLENLVQTLVPEGDPLIQHARASTSGAVSLGSQFPPQDLPKAELHCWLAWQKEPGLSFGTALKTKLFRHDSPDALAFVSWFRSLFGI